MKKEVEIIEDDDVLSCPHCGSTNVERVGSEFGFYVCNECDKEFQTEES